MRIECAAVLGLGLMGGSVARELAARRTRVLGYDPDSGTAGSALVEGVVERILPASLAGIEEAEVIVLAAPVGAALRLMQTVGGRERARLITDVGSTKRSIVEAAVRIGVGDRFVGAHPLAGDHCSGWQSGRTGLFADARIFLTPTFESLPATIQMAEAFWTRMGGRTELIPADAHDARLAWTSHLPQVVSSAAGAALSGQGIAPDDLGPGGRDVTRLAASAPRLWAEIAADNADALVPALAAVQEQLAAFTQLLDDGDATALEAWFAAAAGWAGIPKNAVESVAAGGEAG